MVGELLAEMSAAGASQVAVYRAEDADAVWQQRRRLPAAMAEGPAVAARLKISVPLSVQAALVRLADQLARDHHLEAACAFHAGSGVGHIYLADRGQAGETAVVETLRRMGEFAGAAGGFAILESAPLALRRELEILPPRSDYGLMRSIRQSLNPHETINPGKLV